MTRVVVLAPDLLGPWAQEFREYVSEQLEAPALSWLLSRGTRATPPPGRPTFESVLCRLYNVPADGDAPFAHAAFSAIADGLSPDDGEALARLDPVFLNVTPHGAETVSGAQLALTRDEAEELVEFLNAELDAPWRIEMTAPTRWYVRLPSVPALSTTPPAAMVGSQSTPVLPEGEAGRPWRRWLTEVQMLLHAHPLNALREQAAMRPINSVWLWGQGAAPASPSAVSVSVTCTDSSVLRGLASWHGSPVSPLADATQTWSEAPVGATVAIVNDSCMGLARSGDVEGWRAALETLERDCFAPLVTALRQRRIAQLALHAPGAASAHVGDMARFKFWRPARPLSAWLSDV